MIEAMEAVDIHQFNRWQAYVTALMQATVNEVQADPSKAKLIYDTNTPDLEGERFGEQVNNKVVKVIYQHMAEHYQMPKYKDIQKQLLVTFSMIDSIFRLSYRQHGEITPVYLQEATTASIAYLRCYLPENLPLIARS